MCGPADCTDSAFPAWPAELPAQLPRQLHGDAAGHSGLLEAQTLYEQQAAQVKHEVILKQQGAQLGAQMPPAGQQQPAPLQQEHTVFEEMFLRSISNWTSTAATAQGGSSRLAEPWQDRVAFLIKTGSRASQQRGAILLLTWLSGVKNFVFVGDKPGGEHRLGRRKDTETGGPATDAMAVIRLEVPERPLPAGGRIQLLTWLSVLKTLFWVHSKSPGERHLEGWGSRCVALFSGVKGVEQPGRPAGSKAICCMLQCTCKRAPALPSDASVWRYVVPSFLL